MAQILCIETSGKICSVAWATNGELRGFREITEANSHSKYLTVLIEELFQEHSEKPDAIFLCMGPGSYTGLRIGASAAKGLAYALDIPIMGIDSTQLIMEAFRQQNDPDSNDLICPMIDARRAEVYTLLFNSSGKEIIPLQPVILDESSFQEELNKSVVWFVGDGAKKTEDIIQHPNAKFDHTTYLLARYMVPLAEQYFVQANFEDTAYFEPNYLKDFMATKPRKTFF